MDPPPVARRDNKDCVRVLGYSDYTTIKGWRCCQVFGEVGVPIIPLVGTAREGVGFPPNQWGSA